MMPKRVAGLRLLVVEDEALVAMLIEDILLDLDCVVIGPVGTVPQALALLHQEEIDGALLDVNLGGGERSYPIADALAARKVPFVFVTGYGESGVDGRYAPVTVLQKPFDPRRLERVVANDLAGSSRRPTRRVRR
jgi:two-component SAPR family response regulator